MRSAIAFGLLIACGGAPAPPPTASRAAAVPPSRETCNELVEHAIDLAWLAHASEVAEGHGPVGTWSDGYGEDRHEYTKELRVAQGPQLAERCAHATVPHVDCALAAETVDAVTRCDASLALDGR